MLANSPFSEGLGAALMLIALLIVLDVRIGATDLTPVVFKPTEMRALIIDQWSMAPCKYRACSRRLPGSQISLI